MDRPDSWKNLVSYYSLGAFHPAFPVSNGFVQKEGGWPQGVKKSVNNGIDYIIRVGSLGVLWKDWQRQDVP